MGRVVVLMARPDFQNLRVYRMAETISDCLWDVVKGWSNFERDTMGKQLIRAADSIGANIAEGAGRGSYLDNKRFVKIARGSYNQTLHFLRPAFTRSLVSDEQTAVSKPLLADLGPSLKVYQSSIGRGDKSKPSPAAGPPNNCPRQLTTDH